MKAFLILTVLFIFSGCALAQHFRRNEDLTKMTLLPGLQDRFLTEEQDSQLVGWCDEFDSDPEGTVLALGRSIWSEDMMSDAEILDAFLSDGQLQTSCAASSQMMLTILGYSLENSKIIYNSAAGGDFSTVIRDSLLDSNLIQVSIKNIPGDHYFLATPDGGDDNQNVRIYQGWQDKFNFCQWVKEFMGPTMSLDDFISALQTITDENASFEDRQSSFNSLFGGSDDLVLPLYDGQNVIQLYLVTQF